MGANAQTTVPKFVAANTLPASSLNITAGTGIPVFANTTTRDAAFGGSNKALAQGQTCYLESTNVVQYYNGSAWATVGPTTAASAGLVCVKAETAFSAVANVTADGIFTSSYTNYMMWINYTTSGVNFMGAKLRTGGTSSSTGYTYQTLQGYVSSPSTSATTGTSQLVGYYTNGVDQISVVQIGNPQLAKRTTFVVDNPGLAGALNYSIQGIHTVSTAYDGIELVMDTGTMTGTYAIYGYSKTV